MKILIFWEQDYYGGVDKHLIELLKTCQINRIKLVLTNEENEAANSFTNKKEFLQKKLRVVKFKSFSHNIINFKLRKFKNSTIFSLSFITIIILFKS